MTRYSKASRHMRYVPPPSSKENDIGYLLERYRRLALRCDPGKPETEFAADMALADLVIAAVPLLPEGYRPTGSPGANLIADDRFRGT